MILGAWDSMAPLISLISFLLVIWPKDTEAALGIPDFLEMGNCAKVPFKEDFDPVKYSGLWFDIESVPNEYQHTKKCVTQNYAWKDTFMNVATRGLTTENKKVKQGAVMRVEKVKISPPNPAYMTVEASGVPAAPYQIISSDYRTYSCVYSCLEYFGFRAEFFWIFGRTPTLPAEKIKLCHNTFESLKINYNKMVPIVQGESCPYFDKLDAMVQENEEYLLKVLGPYVPTSIAPTPLPPTTPAPSRESIGTIEKELKEIKVIVQEERKIIQELEKKTDNNKSSSKTGTTPRVPEDSSATSASSSLSVLLISVFVTALLRQ